MDQPTKSNGSSAPSGEERGREGSQKTVLLSDIPDAQTLIDEAATTPAKLSLTTSSLTALSQRYDVLGEAGHGAMGNVYKARDRETGETVALKLLKPEIASDQAMMERFKNELLFARKITHKNVCRVYEFNRVGRRGVHLDGICGRRKPAVGAEPVWGLAAAQRDRSGVANLLGTERGARAGDRASRPEAGKRDDRQARQREDHGFRHRAFDGSGNAARRER